MDNKIIDKEEVELNPALVIGGIGLVRSLSKTRIPFYVGSDIEDTPSLYSRYTKRKVMFSTFESEAFIAELKSFGKKLSKRAVFLSDDDRTILLFSRFREELEPYFIFNLPDKEIVDIILDKKKFPEMAQQKNLPIPRSFTPKTFNEFSTILNNVIFPCIIKPAHKEDWWHPDFALKIGPYKKAIECNNIDELKHYYSRVIEINPNAIIQELVPGDDSQLYSVNLYFSKDQGLKGYFTAHKHRTCPIHAGIGCLVETIDNKEILDLSLDIARKLDIRGFCNIQYKRDSKTNELKIMELHTRNSVWSYLGTMSGCNITAIGYYDMISKEYPGSTMYQTGVKYIDIVRDFRAFLDYRKIGEWTFSRWIKSLTGKKCYILFAWDDPLPFIMDILFSLKQFWVRLNKKENVRIKKQPGVK